MQSGMGPLHARRTGPRCCVCTAPAQERLRGRLGAGERHPCASPRAASASRRRAAPEPVRLRPTASASPGTSLGGALRLSLRTQAPISADHGQRPDATCHRTRQRPAPRAMRRTSARRAGLLRPALFARTVAENHHLTPDSSSAPPATADPTRRVDAQRDAAASAVVLLPCSDRYVGPTMFVWSGVSATPLGRRPESAGGFGARSDQAPLARLGCLPVPRPYGCCSSAPRHYSSGTPVPRSGPACPPLGFAAPS